MGIYIFKIKNDKSDDKFGIKFKCNSLEEAIKFFAKIKNLPIEKFKEIYEVKQIK